jgi:hypothetical protein
MDGTAVSPSKEIASKDLKKSVSIRIKRARGDEPISEVWYYASDEELMG